MNPLDLLHGRWIYDRRVHALRDALVDVLPVRGRILDVGCGDGRIDRLVLDRRPDLHIQGIDVLVRERTHVPVDPFDGAHIPHPDESFDAVLFVDVLHHTDDPGVLLREAARVARRSVVVKDHLLTGAIGGVTLRLMDWVGNARHGVALPYNYWPEDRWRATFASLGLSTSAWRTDLRLYPFPLDLVFGDGLHYVARLDKAA